jgi:membrane-associated phospholipid phosphatase
MVLLLVLLVASVVVTVAVATSFGPVLAVDRVVADGLHAFALGHPGLVTAAQVWTDVFQPWTFRAVLIFIGLGLLARSRRRTGVWILLTTALGGILDSGLKILIGRDRPHWIDPVSHAIGGSFPSGHSLTSAMACAVLLRLAWPLVSRRWAWSTVAVAVPLITGFTRMFLGVHFLSDVIGGWLVGAGLVLAMTLVDVRHQPNG